MSPLWIAQTSGEDGGTALQQAAQVSHGMAAVAFTIGAGIVLVLVAFGVLSRRAFEDAPPRDGELGWGDLLATVGLLLLGPALVATIVARMQDAGLVTAEEPQATLASMLAAQVGAAPVLIYLVVRVTAVVKGGLRTFGFGCPRPGATALRTSAAILLAIPLTFCTMQVSGWLAFNILDLPTPVLAHKALEAFYAAPWGPTRVGMIISAVVLASVIEETVFRGMMQTALVQSGLVGRWPAILIVSALFAFVHSVVAPHALPALFVLAVGLGWLYERSRSLWAPIALHAVFNAINLGVALLIDASAVK